MKLTPSDMIPKTDRETVTARYDLSAKLGTDTIASVEMDCQPSGLTLGVPFAGATDITFNVGGGMIGGVYTVSAICTLESGNVVEPWTILRVVDAGNG